MEQWRLRFGDLFSICRFLSSARQTMRWVISREIAALSIKTHKFSIVWIPSEDPEISPNGTFGFLSWACHTADCEILVEI
jgi:hypothetical protein